MISEKFMEGIFIWKKERLKSEKEFCKKFMKFIKRKERKRNLKIKELEIRLQKQEEEEKKEKEHNKEADITLSDLVNECRKQLETKQFFDFNSCGGDDWEPCFLYQCVEGSTCMTFMALKHYNISDIMIKYDIGDSYKYYRKSSRPYILSSPIGKISFYDKDVAIKAMLDWVELLTELKKS